MATAKKTLTLLVVLGLSMISPVRVPAAAYTNLLTQTNLIDGTEIGIWEPDGGPALNNSTVLSEYQALKSPVVRYGVYDCFTDETCGIDNHTGSLSKTTFETTVSGIVNTLHAIPWIKLPPVAKGAIGSVSNGAVLCPPSTNWGMNLALDKEVLQAISTVYKGPIIVEDNNEAEYACYSAWGFANPGAVGVSTDIGHMWSATMPALKNYALNTLGFSQMVSVGYIGLNGGPQWGQSCTPNSSYPYGYDCAVSSRWIAEFNNQVHTDYTNATTNKSYYIPNVESVHSYCHSPVFATNPYTFDNNECYAFQREQLTNFRSRVNSIWGSTTGNNLRFAVSEWQAGVCTSRTSNCWSGWTTSGNQPGSYDDGFLSMLAGNGVTTGTGTAYWGAALFEAASNSDSAPSGYYNIIGQDGSEPSWYANIKTDFTQAPSPCSISEDASTPAAVHSTYGAKTLSTASFSPPAGSLLEVMVDGLHSGVTVTLSDSTGGTYTAGPHIQGTTQAGSIYFFQRYLPSAPGSMTVTASQSGSTPVSMSLAVRVVDGAASSQSGAASATTTGSGSSQYGTLTTTQNGSWVYAVMGNGDASDIVTPLSTMSNVDVWNDSSQSGNLAAMGRSASATGTPAATNFGWTANHSDNFVWAAQEILPASC